MEQISREQAQLSSSRKRPVMTAQLPPASTVNLPTTMQLLQAMRDLPRMSREPIPVTEAQMVWLKELQMVEALEQLAETFGLMVVPEARYRELAKLAMTPAQRLARQILPI